MDYNININKICRVCLEENVLTSIFNTDFAMVPAEMLMLCAKVKVRPDDGLPSVICNNWWVFILGKFALLFLSTIISAQTVSWSNVVVSLPISALHYCFCCFPILAYTALVLPTISNSNAKTLIYDCVRIWEYWIKVLELAIMKQTQIPIHTLKFPMMNKMTKLKHQKGKFWAVYLRVSITFCVLSVNIETVTKRNYLKSEKSVVQSHKLKCRKHAMSAINRSSPPHSFKFT